MDGKKKLEELVARVDRHRVLDKDMAASLIVEDSDIRSISDAYKAMEAENERLRALIAVGDDAHRSIVRESATPSAMKDDLVEKCAEAVQSCGYGAGSREIADAVLAIARPAILEEAVAKVQYRHDSISNTDDCRACCRNVIRDLRALAHTTGQEGGR